MNIIADLHTHTVASGHALSSVQEMITGAKNLGYEAIAITDHGPAVPGAQNSWYFEKLVLMPDIVDEVLVLKGVEANVLDDTGAVDLPDGLMKKLDWVIASMHSQLIRPMDKEKATDLWLRIAENPLIDMIGHSEQGKYAYDYDQVTKAFAAHNKVVEMNAGSATARPGNEQNLRELALCCMRNGTHIAVNSDAHSVFEMGNERNVLAMLRDIGFPEEYVVNSSMQHLMETLRRHGRAIAGRVKERQLLETGAVDEQS